MQIIYRAKDITEAHIVSGMLQAGGIRTYVGGYYLQGGIGDLAPFDFANVQVADEDVAEASAMIAEYEQADEQPEVETEQNQGSSRWRPVVFMLTTLFIVLGSCLRAS